jgi:hypothetical protein
MERVFFVYGKIKFNSLIRLRGISTKAAKRGYSN